MPSPSPSRAVDYLIFQLCAHYPEGRAACVYCDWLSGWPRYATHLYLIVIPVLRTKSIVELMLLNGQKIVKPPHLRERNTTTTLKITKNLTLKPWQIFWMAVAFRHFHQLLLTVFIHKTHQRDDKEFAQHGRTGRGQNTAHKESVYASQSSHLPHSAGWAIKLTMTRLDRCSK